MRYFTFFFILSLQSWCVFYLYNSSQFGLATFQSTFDSHILLVTTLSITGLWGDRSSIPPQYDPSFPASSPSTCIHEAIKQLNIFLVLHNFIWMGLLAYNTIPLFFLYQFYSFFKTYLFHQVFYDSPIIEITFSQFFRAVLGVLLFCTYLSYRVLLYTLHVYSSFLIGLWNSLRVRTPLRETKHQLLCHILWGSKDVYLQ